MIIELAGLPGGGKTTICKNVKTPHGVKGAVSRFGLRPDANWRKASLAILRLALAARPITRNRLKRAINLTVFLRHYQHPEMVILLDQGLVQKLWSLLADVEVIPEDRLQDVLQALKPFAPRYVVWLETPVEEAVARMQQRSGGNSRYDGIPLEEAKVKLQQRQELLKSLAQRLTDVSGAGLVQLDGSSSAAVNAACVDGLLKR